MSSQEQTTPDQTISPLRDEKLATHSLWETALADPSLKSFLDLVKAAGLEPLLRGPDLLTVLAPMNEAFERGKRPVEHAPDYILRRALTEDELGASKSVKNLRGELLEIIKEESGIRIGGARVVRADIECTNGVIHVIDSLLQSAAPSALEPEKSDLPART